MFVYEKKLEYPVRIRNANPALARFLAMTPPQWE